MVVTASPASAMCDVFSSAICSWTSSSRSTGSATCTGRSYSRVETRLSGTPWPSSCRIETGTAERTTARSASSPRESSSSRYPPLTAASTTSLMVPPNAARIVRTSRGSRTNEPRRGGGRSCPRSTAAAWRRGRRRSGRALGRSRARRRSAPTGSVSAERAPRAVATDIRGQATPGVEHLREASRLRPGRPRLRGRQGRVGLRVEEHAQQLDAGDAVDHAVVDLEHERPAPALEALDQPRLPERSRAIERQ